VYTVVAVTLADIGPAVAFPLGSTTARSLMGWKKYPVMSLISSGHGTIG